MDVVTNVVNLQDVEMFCKPAKLLHVHSTYDTKEWKQTTEQVWRALVRTAIELDRT